MGNKYCTGYYYECLCNECEEVRELYEELEWFEKDGKEFNRDIIKEIEDKIESMGYFI